MHLNEFFRQVSDHEVMVIGEAKVRAVNIRLDAHLPHYVDDHLEVSYLEIPTARGDFEFWAADRTTIELTIHRDDKDGPESKSFTDPIKLRRFLRAHLIPEVRHHPPARQPIAV